MTDRDSEEAWEMLEEIHEAVTTESDGPDMPRWYPPQTSEIGVVLRIISDSDTVTAKDIESMTEIADGTRPCFNLWRLGYINRTRDSSGRYIYTGLTDWGREVLDTDQTTMYDVQEQAGENQSETRSEEPKYRCDKCGETFENPSNYGGHMASHKSEEMYWTNPNGSNVSDERAKEILQTAANLPVERFNAGQLNAFIDHDAASFLTRLYRAGAVNRDKDPSDDGRKRYIYRLTDEAKDWVESQSEE